LQLRSFMDKAQIQNYVAVNSEDYGAIANIYDTVAKSGLAGLQ
jgi:phosphonate transport system substrate-binding protein